ncbi:MAG: cation transporter [Clostridia bacterium]|nr:cation transporter [Clostridia bacterium]
MEIASIAAKKVGIIGIISNLFLLSIKFIVGLIFKSQGLIADAVNSFGDVFSSIITYVAGKISEKPADEDHEFGHGKAEFVASFLIGIFMVMVSLETLYSGIMSIINNQAFTFSYLLIIVPIVTIITKGILYFYCYKQSKKYDSLLILSNASDHRNDIILSIGVIIGVAFGYFGYYFVDGIVGIIISVIIIITGVKIIKEAYDVLIDKCIDVETVNEMKNRVERTEGVNHLDSIKSKPTGALHMLIVKVSVDPEMTVRQSHNIAASIRSDLKKYPNVYDAVVHINPDE